MRICPTGRTKAVEIKHFPNETFNRVAFTPSSGEELTFGYLVPLWLLDWSCSIKISCTKNFPSDRKGSQSCLMDSLTLLVKQSPWPQVTSITLINEKWIEALSSECRAVEDESWMNSHDLSVSASCANILRNFVSGMKISFQVLHNPALTWFSGAKVCTAKTPRAFNSKTSPWKWFLAFSSPSLSLKCEPACYSASIAPLRVTFLAIKTSKQSLGIQPESRGDRRERSENFKIHFQFSLLSLRNGSKRAPKGFKRSTWQSSKVIHPQFSLKLQCKRNGTYTFVHMSFHAINSRVAEREAGRSGRTRTCSAVTFHKCQQL